MGLWIFMVLMDLMTPLLLVGCGKYFMTSGPGEINMFFGYRTKMSMKNTETWKFAHAYVGKLWFNIGRLLLLSVLLMFFVIGKDLDTMGIMGGIIMCAQMVFLVGSIFPTERALRKNFDKDGNRISKDDLNDSSDKK